MRDRLRLPPLSLPAVITFVVVAASSLFVFFQLKPQFLFMNSLTAGGDMGAHVWLPWFLKEHLLSHGRLTGWTPDWYAGFPALTFYFPLPAILIALLSFVIPYDIAFKLITVSGVISLPIAAWAFGRLARLPFPAPACLAAATVPFLFDTGYTILGGNIASTLAGEFSFSIGLSLSIVFLGLVAGGLQTNKRRAWAALLFGLVILCHILPTIFALTGGILLLIMRLIAGGRVPDERKDPPGPWNPAHLRWILPLTTFGLVMLAFAVISLASGAASGYAFAAAVVLVPTLLATLFVAPHRQRKQGPFEDRAPKGARWAAIKWGVPVGVVGGLISGFWALPFVVNSNYMNDMGWEKIGTGTEAGMKLYNQSIVNYSDALFPKDLAAIIIAGLCGAALAIYFRRRMGVFWVLIATISAITFIVLPQGRLWNARLLPFYYLSLYMLAGHLVSELGWGVADLVSKTGRTRKIETEEGEERIFNEGEDYAEGLRIAAPLLAIALALSIVVPKLPTPGWWPLDSGRPWHDPNTNGVSFIPSWAEWNYSGYDGKKSDGSFYKPAYVEYSDVVDMMRGVGNSNGCGRVMWEYEGSLDRFGTPMALMLLPMHTNGCMASMEGLFFESSATVPYHFLNQAELSKEPSSAMRDLPYGTLDVSDGVSKLQVLGVKYYLAVSPDAQQQAAQDPRLTLVASTSAQAASDGTARTWNAYEIQQSDLVAPLENEPVVLSDPESITSRRDGKADAEESLSPREAWLENSLAWYDDPAKRQVSLAADGPSNWQRIDNAQTDAPIIPVTDPARVSRIGTSDDRISFHVDNPGSPVVVRASYFPNWKVEGAKGPYRLTPNLMVVVPTSTEVSLHYGHEPVDIVGVAMTIAGIFGVALLFRVDRRVGDLLPERRSIQDRRRGRNGPHLVKVESSADGTNAEVLEIHNPPHEPKTS